MRKKLALGLIAVPTVMFAGITGVHAAQPPETPATAGAIRYEMLTGVDPAAAPPVAAQSAGAKLAVLSKEIGGPAFKALGVTWTPADTADITSVAVRTRVASTWSGWRQLELEEYSEGLGRRDGTRMDFVGTADAAADGAQVQVSTRSGRVPGDMVLTLIDPAKPLAPAPCPSPSPSTSDPAAAPDLPAIPHGTGPVPQPQVLTREDWGANKGANEGIPQPALKGTGSAKAVFIAHSAHTEGTAANGYTREDVPEILQSIYRFLVSPGPDCKPPVFDDFPYNFVVDKFGRVFEGRAGSINHWILGGHTRGFNTNTLGIGALGNFELKAPSPELLDGMAGLIAWKLGISGADPLGKATLTGGPTAEEKAGKKVEFNVIAGHRDARPTESPGELLYQRLPQLREMVAKRLAGPSDPPVTPSDPPVTPSDPSVTPSDPPVTPSDPPADPSDPPV